MNIETLKEGFTQVKIKHFGSNLKKGEMAYRGTHVALVKDNKVYTGIARCHEGDQFNKRLGREIAIGRAMHAWKVDSGIIKDRGNLLNKTGCWHVAEVTPEKLDSYLSREVFTEPTPQLMPVEPEIVCCGNGACSGKSH